MNFKTADVAGLRLFYREAGDPSKPTIVLLHGFPSSSYTFHDLIPRLKGKPLITLVKDQQAARQ